MRDSSQGFADAVAARGRRLLAFLVLSILASISAQAQTTLNIADSVQTYATLTNTTVTMTGKSELHVTGTSNPIAGSVIHLNSKDAWFWLDNIRPNTADNYLGQIRVNGAVAVHGTNVRVVQYGMGTVIAPFTSGEQPLETFTDPKFSGASKLYNLYTYYDSSTDLGAMHRNISSFKLKRGFMATFATQANGSGASKVYIAQDHDVNVASLPSNLDDAIQFVRVFPWRWVSKKGSCDVSPDVLNAAWYYNWNNDQNSTLNWEYVPIRQQRWWPGYPTNKANVTHLSGYNEPDNPVEDSYESLGGGSRDAAIAAWPELLATGLRVGSPACTDGGKWWLFEFMDKANAEGLRVDYITIHFYRCGQSAAQLKSFLQEIWDRYRKPIWLTEFNNGANWTSCADPTTDQNATAINSFIDMMDSTPWIERYAVYSNVEWQRNMTWEARWDGSAGLTPAGVIYRDQQSPIGYQQEAYPLAVKRGVAHLPFDGDTRDLSGYDNRGISHGSPAFAAGQRGQSLQLDGTARYVQLPAGLVNDNDAFTFAAWVFWEGGGNWQRIFDFGTSTSAYLFLTPSNGSVMRFGIKNGSSEQTLDAPTLPVGQWSHVAVTVGGGAARLYVNGSLAATNNAVTVTPASIGATRNYLGKSQYPDPLFKGRLDEVVIADSVWSQQEIAALMTSVPPPFQAHWKGDMDGNWSTNNGGQTNWSDAAGGTDAGQVPGASTDVVFTASGATNASNTVLGANYSIAGLTVTSSSAVGIGGAHHLTIGPSGITLAAGAGATTINTAGQLQLGGTQTWTIDSSNPLTVSSAVSGTGMRLVKEGTGTLVLSGANTYTGGTTLNSGSVVIGSNAVFGSGTVDLRGATLQASDVTTRSIANAISLSADTTFAGAGDLVFNGAVNAGNLSKVFTVSNARTIFNGAISGGGTRTKTGAGNLVLNGVNTYTGATTVNAGTLTVNGSLAAASTVTVTNAATLAGTGTISGPISFASTTRFGWNLSSNVAAAGRLNAGTVNVASGARVDLTFNAAGSSVDFSNVFWAQPRSWQVLSSTGMTGSFALGTISPDAGGRQITNYGTFYLQQTSSGVTLFFAPAGSEPPASPTNVIAESLPGAVNLSWSRPPGATSFVVRRSTSSDGPYTTIAADVLDATFTDTSVTNNVLYYYVIVAANVNGEGEPSAEIRARPHLPSTIDKADNATDLRYPTSWAEGIPPNAFDTARWTGLGAANSVLLGSDLKWNGIAIGNTGGAVSIGAGHTLTLGSGGVDLSAATQNLTISSGFALGAGQTWKVAAGRTLTLAGAFSRGAGATLLVDRSSHAGVVAVPLPLTDGIVGPWAAVKSASVASNNGVGGFTFATVTGGAIAPYTGATPLTAGFWTAPGSNTVSYDISGASVNMGVSRVAKTLRYTGAAATTYTVNSGATMTLNGMMNAGGGLWTYNPGVIIGSSGGNELVLNSGLNGLALTGVIANGATAGAVVIAGESVVTLTGANTYTGGTVVSSGKLVATPAALNGGPITIQTGGTLTFTGNNQTSSSAVTGAGTIHHDTANTIIFTGDHSGFSGNFIHAAGGNNTQFNSANSGSAAAAYAITAGELIFALSGNYTVKMGSLASTGGNIRGGNSATGTTTLEVGRLGTDSSIAGNLNNGATKVMALTKVGAGTLTMLGTSNYSGGTLVNAGTLRVDGTLTGNGTMVVSSGATLSGSGSILAPVNVVSGGAISPGNANGAGALSFSSAVTLNNGSVLNMRLAAPGVSARLALTGSLNAGGTTTVNVAALAGFSGGTYALITGTGPINPSSFALGTIPDGTTCVLTASNNTLWLVVAPKAPTGLTAAGASALSIVLSWGASAGATSYTVKRSTTSDTDYVVLTPSGVNGTSYTDTDVAAGTTYYYVVSATNQAGESADSNEASASALSGIDAWRQQYFGTTANEGNAADAANPSGDGLPNLVKYAMALAPNEPTPLGAPRAEVAGGTLAIAFTRNASARDVTLSVDAADSPSGPWTEIARSSGGAAFEVTSAGATVSEIGAGEIRAVEVGDIYPLADSAHPARFLRVRVER